MKKLVLTLMALVIAVPAFATESRMQGLGGVSGYVEDDTDVFIWPQTVAKWSNRAIAELGTTGTTDGSRTAGVNFNMPRIGGHGALYVNRPPVNSVMNGYSAVDESIRNNYLMYSKGNWGAQIGFGTDTFTDDEADTTGPTLTDESLTMFGAGIGISMDGSKFDTDLGAKVNILSGKREFQNSDLDEDESGFSFHAAARNFYDRSSNAGRLISQLGFGLTSAKVEDGRVDGEIDETKTTTTEFGLGLGWEVPASRDVLVMLVVEPVTYVKEKTEFDFPGSGTAEETETTLIFPAFFAAVEAKITGWLTGRVGVGQNYSKITMKEESTPDGGETTTTMDESAGFSNFAITLGLGAMIGKNIWIDGVFNDQYLYWGPDFISGDGDSSPGSIMSRISVGAHWQ